MWHPEVKKLQRQLESERLERAEKNIKKLTETVVEMQKRIEELEKKNETI